MVRRVIFDDYIVVAYSCVTHIPFSAVFFGDQYTVPTTMYCASIVYTAV